MTFAVLAAVSVPRLFAITVEVGDGESEAVKIVAENLRIDIARACPNHAKDSRRIVVRTKAGGPWESSTRTYANGVWTVTGADRRGTVYGIYAISDELGVSPFHWMDDIPVAQCEKFDLSTNKAEIDKYWQWAVDRYLKQEILWTIGIRKPELMAKQWVEKLTDAEKKSLMSQYVALEKEDLAIEEEFRKLPTPPLPHSLTPPLLHFLTPGSTPLKEGAGKGAWMEYEVEGRGGREEGRGGRELVLQFLPDYRLYPGMKLRVEVSVNGGVAQIVEVPYSDGTRDENSQGRSMAVPGGIAQKGDGGSRADNGRIAI